MVLERLFDLRGGEELHGLHSLAREDACQVGRFRAFLALRWVVVEHNVFLD